MGKNTNITAITIGTSPFMTLCCPSITEPIRDVVERLVTKCPKLQHLILHGLNLCFHTIYYLCRNLPATMKGINIAIQTLFRELTIHLSPYTPEDKEFYKKNGFPKPNPKFPPPLDSHHFFRHCGRGGENFTLENTC